jgi:hypothetical protein
MLRIVPDRDRTTRECVDASPREYRTPDSNSLSVIPVAAKKTFVGGHRIGAHDRLRHHRYATEDALNWSGNARR